VRMGFDGIDQQDIEHHEAGIFLHEDVIDVIRLLLRGLFILRKLREHDPARLQDVLADLYRDDVPDPQDIGKFEWQTILVYMGATDEEVRDVQKRMGRVWR